MMRFADFLAKAHSVFGKPELWMKSPDFPIPPLSESHVFLLGNDGEFNEALNEIDIDLKMEMDEKVPMPFSDISTVSTVSRPMTPFTLEQMQKNIAGISPSGSGIGGDLVEISGNPVWILDRLVEVDESHPAAQEIIQARADPRGHVNISDVSQWFVMFRYHGVTGKDVVPMPLMWVFGYAGVARDKGNLRIIAMSNVSILANEMAEACRYVTAISHPAQYVVKVTPALTPKEHRRCLNGKDLPREKTPHFLVVDHEVISRMRKDPAGTHASPVPHERRGHWARLAERCRHAKLLGKDKIWKRPTFVGERVWTDEKNLYEVLLDFGKKAQPE